MTEPYDRPTKAELLAAVRRFLSSTLSDEVSGRMAFHCRVAANMLAIVERELASENEHATAHQARVSRLNMTDDAELAANIASGAVDDRYGEINAVLREAVWDKLTVANPKYKRPFTNPHTAKDELFQRSD